MVIGIYDSGLGGLSVWRYLKQHTNVQLLYFGDTAHVPYGEKTPLQLQGYFWDILDFFRTKGCQGVVVACNTSSALVLPQVRGLVKIPVIGIIEGAVEAVSQVSAGRVGVLATRATAASGVYQAALQKALPHGEVFVQSAPNLVPLVEQGLIEADSTKKALAEYLTPLLNQKIDTLLLGCTHYPFLLGLIAELAGPSVKIVDPAPTVALKVRQALPELMALTELPNAATEFWVSSDPKRFQNMAELLLQERISPVGLHHMPGERA